MRIYRTDQMDLHSSPAEPIRIERIRELVDELPEGQRLVVSGVFFGGGSPTLTDVAMDTGLTVFRVKDLLANGISNLRAAVLEDDRLGPLFADGYVGIDLVLSALAVGDDVDHPGSVLPREGGEGSGESDLGLDVEVGGEQPPER